MKKIKQLVIALLLASSIKSIDNEQELIPTVCSPCHIALCCAPIVLCIASPPANPISLSCCHCLAVSDIKNCGVVVTACTLLCKVTGPRKCSSLNIFTRIN